MDLLAVAEGEEGCRAAVVQVGLSLPAALLGRRDFDVDLISWADKGRFRRVELLQAAGGHGNVLLESPRQGPWGPADD